MRIMTAVAMFLGIAGTALAQESLRDLPTRLELADVEAQDQKKQPAQEEMKVPGTTLRDEQREGPYNQPVWTEHRPSPVTRIYLQVLPGGAEYEQWAEIRIRRHRDGPNDSRTQVRFQEEFEFGLGGRFQLDMYARETYEAGGPNSTLEIRGWSAELRYALADWGVIPANPTLYLEYIVWNHKGGEEDADPASSNIEGKLLFGDEMMPNLHWGLNLAHERTLGGRSVSIYENVISGTLMYTIVDGLLSGGLAVQGVYEADRDYRPGGFGYERTRELYIGPSIQLRMAYRELETDVIENGKKTKVTVRKPRAHVDIEPLVGIGPESKRAKIFLVFGWDF
jgi:hypothetical protein